MVYLSIYQIHHTLTEAFNKLACVICENNLNLRDWMKKQKQYIQTLYSFYGPIHASNIDLTYFRINEEFHFNNYALKDTFDVFKISQLLKYCRIRLTI